ncbi:MAG: S8 family serine peptidase, partial [Chloroflexota bacterium]
MFRRVALLFLLMLVAFPIVAPATATEPAATPAVEPPVVAAPTPTQDGPLDARGRFIVVLRDGANTAAVVDKVRKRDGVKADRTFGKALRGFSAKLDAHQKRDLLADPAVVSVVPDEVIHLTAQQVPTGVSRVGGLVNEIAKIDGEDTRVDADVAIVDTGITAHPDLNLAGGHNCATSDPNAWRDRNHHGTHVAGTVGALDNDIGVVGVAPGARVWGVRILNDDGDGLISWYLCGLNWILAQRDPNDASRPLFEAVNMSVTKAGSDDHNCGYTTKDLLHQAICRVVAGGITVVAAAANDSHSATHNIPASYDEVITVSALADTDGKPGGLGGNLCYSWGGYDKDDTFADFSNYGHDVDLIAPGKCIRSTIPPSTYGYISGTSMSAPTVTGAVALYKESRPKATPAEVREALRYLGNLNWNVATDPDTTHEPLLDVSRIGPLGTFSLTPGGPGPTAEGGNTVLAPFSIVRSETFFERVSFSVTSLPTGWAASAASVMGWTANTGKVSVKIPPLTPPGTYTIGIRGTN